jgi:hypothetical protein
MLLMTRLDLESAHIVDVDHGLRFETSTPYQFGRSVERSRSMTLSLPRAVDHLRGVQRTRACVARRYMNRSQMKGAPVLYQKIIWYGYYQAFIRESRVLRMVVTGVTLMAAVTTYAATDQDACQKLASLVLPGRQITSAVQAHAGIFQTPDGENYNAPDFCRVRGIARPTTESEIKFEVWLPRKIEWNGRFYQHGEGGGGGAINYGALVGFIRNGAVGVATDDGSQNVCRDSDASLLSQPQKFVDLWYRALGETTRSAKELIRAYYGRAPSFSYFEGCSGGGGYGLQAAQRFPDDWDGILIGAPSNNVTGYYAAMVWYSRAWLDDPQGQILPVKLPAIQRAALASCTSQAHVLNGIAADPRFCPFDPEVLSCNGPETDNCLTKAQVIALRKIYAGPRNPRTGEQIYAGFPPTFESSWADDITGNTLVNPEGTAPSGLYVANRFYRHIFDNPQWNIRMFDFDKSVTFTENKLISGASLKSIMNATNPDLSRLRKRGSKVLMYIGWGDPTQSPLEGIVYYNKVAHEMGGVEKSQDFFRLFMVPGMRHCGLGPGANSFGQNVYGFGKYHLGRSLQNDADHNIMRALEAWVETGRKPDRIIAAKYVNDDPKRGIAFTRPLCAYPQIAVFRGSGSTTEASNFKCVVATP